MALGHGWDLTTKLRFVGFGRKATKHVRTLFDRFWLQAAVRRIAIYICFRSSSGHSDAEFLLMEVLRTRVDERLEAASDPKPRAPGQAGKG